MSLKKLYIIGASGFGRDLESYLDLIQMDKKDWHLEGFLDDNPKALIGYPSNYKVLGSIDEFEFRDNDLVLLAIADPFIKNKIFDKLNSKARFMTYIAPDVFLGKFTEIGEGSVICPQIFIGPNVKIGRGVSINGGTKIGHDVVIGDFCSLMANVTIGGQNQIGKSVYIGSSATIIPGRKICDFARIGTGSIVIQNVKKTDTLFGNPASYI